MTIILDGKTIAQTKRKQLKSEIIKFKDQTGISPKLAAIIVGNDIASQIYVENKAKACQAVGLSSVILRENAELSEESLINLIQKLNQDPSVHGILVQLPLPKHIDPMKVIKTIAIEKDVDGFHPYNIGCLALKSPLLRSCTPWGIMQLLSAYNIEVKGLNATVIGISNIVGKPLGLELLYAGATVSSCHSQTQNIESYIKNSDLIISATGQRNVFDQSVIAQHAIVVDVGIHRINNQLCGDLDFDYLNGKVKYLTPVPGGVGPMTITALLQNTLQAARLCAY